MLYESQIKKHRIIKGVLQELLIIRWAPSKPPWGQHSPKNNHNQKVLFPGTICLISIDGGTLRRASDEDHRVLWEEVLTSGNCASNHRGI